MREAAPRRDGDVVSSDDFVASNGTIEDVVPTRRERPRLFRITHSPLTRKIIVFNLVALNVLMAGLLYLTPMRESLVTKRANVLVNEALLVSDVFETQSLTQVSGSLTDQDNVEKTLAALELRSGIEVFVFDPAGALLGKVSGKRVYAAFGSGEEGRGSTVMTDLLSGLWSLVTAPFGTATQEAPPPPEEQAREMVAGALQGVRIENGRERGGRGFVVAVPIRHEDGAIGVVALRSTSGMIDNLVRREREQVLQMFLIATLVSIGLSLVLASAIANPLSDLATAAETGRNRDRMGTSSRRIRIPDMTARPDEIGRLSGALRGMVGALYERIDGNEEFAADVAHEIKNPLASLRSAVGTMRVAKRADQREQLLQVIEHDVRRLDRLVSDISNVSRLDSELVKEEEEAFNLLHMLDNLGQYLGEEARGKGIDFITDLPGEPIVIDGLEARLAQVFVNLITNAISFCEEGDAIRVWARQRENRVLVVVEDTGPGIPDQALTKVFKRFYSERPVGQFGNNSGLGLAISKQIVEAHGGVIWAENIRPTEADITSDPLGARFVVGLPV